MRPVSLIDTYRGCNCRETCDCAPVLTEDMILRASAPLR
jgi:hypothetical protein